MTTSLRRLLTYGLLVLLGIVVAVPTLYSQQKGPKAENAKPEARAKAEANAKPEANKVSEFMRAKLTHSQKVLEALTTEDFAEMAKHSQEMSLLSQAENWQVLQTPEYRDRSTEFRRACDTLTEAARKKNLEAAALAYVDVTMKCVNCHKYVRHVRMAAAERPLGFQLAGH